MTFAKRVFTVAGIWGLVVLTPLYFSFDLVGRFYPPAITHPDFFYGFIGVAIAWQVAFLVIARDPIRYRLMMLPSILEKATFGIAAIVLYQQHRIPSIMLAFGFVDLTLGVLFAIAFWRTAMRRL